MQANVILTEGDGGFPGGPILGTVTLIDGVSVADLDKAIARRQIRLVALEPPAPEDVELPEEPPTPEEPKKRGK